MNTWDAPYFEGLTQQDDVAQTLKVLDVLLTVRHSTSVQRDQRDAPFIQSFKN
jgi:hypothetical protein